MISIATYYPNKKALLCSRAYIRREKMEYENPYVCVFSVLYSRAGKCSYKGSAYFFCQYRLFAHKG